MPSKMRVIAIGFWRKYAKMNNMFYTSFCSSIYNGFALNKHVNSVTSEQE